MKKMMTVDLYKDNKLVLHYQNINVLVNNQMYTFIKDGIKTILNDKYFIRENKEFKFTLDLKNKKSTYLLKENNLLLDIEVEKIIYKKQNNSIIVEYKLESDEKDLKIELTEKE